MITEANNSGIGIAVIGSGYWGRNLVRNFNQIHALKLICDKNESILADFHRQYPDADICLALNPLLSRNDIHAVAIATPAETHFNIAREALLAGKHVFVEKPLALSETEAKELIDLSEKKQRILMVGHLLQYHPVFSELKKLASSGELGRINYIYSHRLNLGKIRREENILWSFAPHDISMILAIADEQPESVIATGANYLHKKIADVTTTHMEFPSGIRAHIFVSWLHPFKEQKLVVVGDQKMAVFDDTLAWEDKLLLYPHQIRWQNNIPIPSKAEPERIHVPQDEPLRLECEHFIDCIVNKKKPKTDGYEGIRVLEILNASQRSLDGQGKKVYIKEKSIPPASETVDSDDSEFKYHSNYYVHPTAIIDEGATICDSIKIWHFSHILKGSVIGEGTNVGQNVVIGPDVKIGKHCKIQNNVSVYKGVTLEDDVFCGPSMVFTNVFNPRAAIRRMDELRPTLVRKGATLGANCTVVCGITIGEYAFIGAGAVVTKDVPDYALVMGNPARHVGWICQCGEKLNSELHCNACQTSYQNTNRGLARI